MEPKDLKAYRPYANRDGFYHKSEVDKLIAEMDAKILSLDAEVFKQKHHAKLFLDERNYAEEKHNSVTTSPKQTNYSLA